MAVEDDEVVRGLDDLPQAVEIHAQQGVFVLDRQGTPVAGEPVGIAPRNDVPGEAGFPLVLDREPKRRDADHSAGQSGACEHDIVVGGPISHRKRAVNPAKTAPEPRRARTVSRDSYSR